ncbi:hypothetical protein ACFL5V_10550 [Fibrobacterota bacterium]
MYRKVIAVLFFIFSLISCVNQVNASDGEFIIRNKLDGQWTGEGRVIVAWCQQKHISFELQLDEHGKVTGTIGDAVIKNGKIKLNHLLYRLLGNREYVIDADLSNFLVEKEEIKRESIRLFLDFEKPFFTGGFHSSGSKFGGKEKMVFSGTGLRLSKTAFDSGQH